MFKLLEYCFNERYTFNKYDDFNLQSFNKFSNIDFLQKKHKTLILSHHFGALAKRYTPNAAKMRLGIHAARAGESPPEMANDLDICMKRI